MKILREPLVHFLLIGAALFAFYLLAGNGKRGADASLASKSIVITSQRIALLHQGFVLDNGRQPADADMQRLINACIREEILVRQAAAQGLDREDSIVRRRLVQRMEFAAPEPVPPTDAALREYLAAHPEEFRTPDGKIPGLKDIQPAVAAAWMTQARKKAADDMYQRLRAQYQITVEQSKPAGTAEGVR